MDSYSDGDPYMDSYFYRDCYRDGDRYDDRFFSNEIKDRKFLADVRDGVLP